MAKKQEAPIATYDDNYYEPEIVVAMDSNKAQHDAPLFDLIAVHEATQITGEPRKKTDIQGHVIVLIECRQYQSKIGDKALTWIVAAYSETEELNIVFHTPVKGYMGQQVQLWADHGQGQPARVKVVAAGENENGVWYGFDRA